MSTFVSFVIIMAWAGYPIQLIFKKVWYNASILFMHHWNWTILLNYWFLWANNMCCNSITFQFSCTCTTRINQYRLNAVYLMCEKQKNTTNHSWLNDWRFKDDKSKEILINHYNCLTCHSITPTFSCKSYYET